MLLEGVWPGMEGWSVANVENRETATRAAGIRESRSRVCLSGTACFT